MAIFGQGPSKKELLNQIEELKKELNAIHLTQEQVKYLDINKEIDKLNRHKNDLKSKNRELQNKVSYLQQTLIGLEDIEEMQSFGIYKTKYGLESSELYNRKLQNIRDKQKAMIKNKTATIHNTSYTVDGDKKKGKEFILDTVKLSLRAFNNECDNIITKTKFNNVEKSAERIKKIYKEINSLTDMQHVSIKTEYLNLKIEELYLKYEYECKKQEESVLRCWIMKYNANPPFPIAPIVGRGHDQCHELKREATYRRGDAHIAPQGKLNFLHHIAANS